MRLPWQLFSFVQNFHVWSLFSCFCRVSNHEKKLEAVRSGVRAISVSGKMEIVLSACNFRRPPSLAVLSTVFSLYLRISCVIFCSFHVSISLIQLTLFASFSSVTLLFTPLTSIHVFFHCQTPVVFSRLAADLMTSTPPKSTRARRFLLPFVFCSDSPPSGILWH